MKTSYYANGKMKYNPEVHKNHKKRWTLEERVYVARFYDFDGVWLIADALMRPEYSIHQVIVTMKKNGEWDVYKSLSHDEYFEIVEARDRGMK
ncbi:hypothetical protein D3C72_247350 [compost metagenome]